MPFAQPRSRADRPPRVDADFFGQIPASPWKRKDLSPRAKVILGGLSILARGRSSVRATIKDIADACGVSEDTSRRGVAELVEGQVIDWQKIGRNFTFQFQLRGSEWAVAGRIDPQPCGGEPADLLGTTPQICGSDGDPLTTPYKELDKDTTTTDAAESLLFPVPPREEKLRPVPTDLVEELLSLFPEATTGMVTAAVVEFSLEWVKRAIGAYKAAKKAPDKWVYFLGILGKYHRQGGPPRLVPPKAAKQQPPTLLLKDEPEPEADVVTAEDLAQWLGDADRRDPFGDIARVQLEWE